MVTKKKEWAVSQMRCIRENLLKINTSVNKVGFRGLRSLCSVLEENDMNQCLPTTSIRNLQSREMVASVRNILVAQTWE